MDLLRLGDNDIISFFIIFQVNFTEAKKKELIEEFKKSVSRSKANFGIGGILPDSNAKSAEDIQKLKYIYPESKSAPTESGDKGIDLFDREEAQIPAAVIVYFEENDSSLFMEGKHSLDNLIDLIGDRPCSLIIEGHTRKVLFPQKDTKTLGSFPLTVQRLWLIIFMIKAIFLGRD